jgi:hypothetical protein
MPTEKGLLRLRLTLMGQRPGSTGPKPIPERVATTRFGCRGFFGHSVVIFDLPPAPFELTLPTYHNRIANDGKAHDTTIVSWLPATCIKFNVCTSHRKTSRASLRAQGLEVHHRAVGACGEPHGNHIARA